MIAAGNLFSGAEIADRAEEAFMQLMEIHGVRIERIVSTGQASPPGYWYDQPEGEWVLLVSGAAGLRIAGEAAPRALQAGDWLDLPPHCRHRVEWTAADKTTVWLAVHYPPTPGGV